MSMLWLLHVSTAQGSIQPDSPLIPSVRVPTLPHTSTYTPHNPIEVTNDMELAAVAVSGSGTVVDPYVLEGWTITTTGTDGISITGTTAHFIIQNCWVEAGSSWPYMGINITSVAPRTVTIFNNTCQNNYYGIVIYKSANVSLDSNLCTKNNRNGITLHKSGNVIFNDNTCTQNNYRGIDLWDSGYATLSKNLCSQNYDAGLYLSYSGNSILNDNTCAQNHHRGIYLEHSSNITLSNNILIDNTGYGISLGRGCEDNTIHHNSFLNNSQGATQASDDGSINQWYDSATDEGNYWSDYSGSGAYQIDGDAGATDPYPLDEYPNLQPTTTPTITPSTTPTTTEQNGLIHGFQAIYSLDLLLVIVLYTISKRSKGS